jgi:hypothetical protein
MAPLEQHMRDCALFLGDGYAEVNRWMDEYFSVLGPSHRKVRHHKEGIDEARSLFGENGAQAAAVHILRDCRHIPRRSDYENGFVDVLGLKKDWPVSAYVVYSEEDFKAMVSNQLFGPSGIFLWSFLNDAALIPLLASATKLSGPDIEGLKERWSTSFAGREKLPPLSPFSNIGTEIPPNASSYVQAFLDSIAGQSLKQNLGEIAFATVPVEALVTPLVFLDGEYLEGLKPELQGSREIDLIKFALPSMSLMQVRAVMDTSRRSVTFLSTAKTLAVGPCMVSQTAEGTEVKFVVGSNLNMILVSLTAGRLIVRNGIHRAFLLAQLGIKNIPCILVKEETIPTLLTSAYPAFTPQVLMWPRPPLLLDYSDSNLSVQVPLQRTNKVIRIVAEESVLPVD